MSMAVLAVGTICCVSRWIGGPGEALQLTLVALECLTSYFVQADDTKTLY